MKKKVFCIILASIFCLCGLGMLAGCGTGTLTELLAKEGYDMIGVDYSEEMLNRAMEKREQSGLSILYLLSNVACSNCRILQLLNILPILVRKYSNHTCCVFRIFMVSCNQTIRQGKCFYDLP